MVRYGLAEPGLSKGADCIYQLNFAFMSSSHCCHRLGTAFFCVFGYVHVFLYVSERSKLQDVCCAVQMSQGPSQARFGRLASESSASGKLSGPLPWDVLDDRSDEENSTAGATPPPCLD